MSEITTTYKPFLIFHRAGWSIGVTAFTGKEGMSWLIFGTNGDHTIQANGKTQVEAWKSACRQAVEMGLVGPV